MFKQTQTERFNQIAMPHLDAAYNLAKWLTRNPQDAEDMVQESFMKALRYFEGFRGDDGRAWLLTIVRNTCYSWLEAKKSCPTVFFDEDEDSLETQMLASSTASLTVNPEQHLMQSQDKALLSTAIEALPLEFREVLILRELEDFSYQQIADIIGAPIGTVMSRLSRARSLLRRWLANDVSPDYTLESAP